MNLAPLFFTGLLQFIVVCRCLNAQLSYGLEAWTLSLSLLNCDSFLFFLPLCCTFAAVLGVIVLLHEPVWAKL